MLYVMSESSVSLDVDIIYYSDEAISSSSLWTGLLVSIIIPLEDYHKFFAVYLKYHILI